MYMILYVIILYAHICPFGESSSGSDTSKVKKRVVPLSVRVSFFFRTHNNISIHHFHLMFLSRMRSERCTGLYLRMTRILMVGSYNEGK